MKVSDVNQLVDRFFEARKMMAAMAGRMGMPGARKNQRSNKKGKKGKKGGRGPTPPPKVKGGFPPGGLPAGLPPGMGGGMPAGFPDLSNMPEGGLDELPRVSRASTCRS